ncbi:Six-hairpin glycosidase-like protein [Daldinia caldariorum]|uniref:Six-hairpin glycosidase-like protein n=1 Tax=Daldinia caldariorum TaxID=326644 RepID=UPI0020084C32|nr:Six-hairpin glycosidase-like protein [Daldinia caldariorum]KAI1465574.1 Six-hairpin glycosidase-like protein [Daldinia caldariorum]
MKGTYELGFMIAPWARTAWELDNNKKGFDAIIMAAGSLMARYSQKVGCITNPDKDFLVAVDDLMSLDTLFWAAAKSKDTRMHEAALCHAKTSQRYHVRADHSTATVVVFDPENGDINRGYADGSCWSRGQAWAITGFAQTYQWTKDSSFLETSKACADYFVEHLPATAIPSWDFQAPGNGTQPTDTIAAIIASYGMLLIHEIETAAGRPSVYLEHALKIIEAVCAFHVNDPVQFVSARDSIETASLGSSSYQEMIAADMENGAKTIFNGATMNNHKFAPCRWANQGLVYADYFSLLVGNKLFDMGISVRPLLSLSGHSISA